MMRYFIIALAVLAGVVISLILARRNKSETVLVEEGSAWTLRAWLPWLGGLAVLAAGLFLLADYERAPADAAYTPAVIGDGDGGKIKPGSFGGGKAE